ncbi:hypothetical protein BH11BAC7_BH11BAC7_20710 [soil metagenome]
MVAVVLTWSAAIGLNAQNGPCNNPPNCIVNNEVGTTPAGNGGDMNSTGPLTVNGWYVSHGTPTMFGNDCPTSSNNNSIWMWSYSGRGEGVYTCYNFQAGQVYTVCLWVRNTNGVLNGGNLRVLAANGLTNIGPASTTIAVPTASQLIANSWGNNGAWTQVFYTFTANANYAELWIYPYMLNGPINNQQYELQIDDIRVTPNTQQVNLGISASPPVIDWCQTSTLAISGAPLGTTVTWSPATGLSATTGLSVNASPCATTTYTAVVTVPGGNPGCPSCGGGGGGTYTLTQQVIVNQPSFSIVGNPNIKCGENLDLRVIPGYFCPEVVYSWTGPNGFTSSNSGFNIGPADGTFAGVYTCTITNLNGGCSYTVSVTVTVNCPCEAKPDFHWDGCNPVSFYGVNTGSSPVITWYWEFGDGQTSTLQNPVHYYAVGGVYKVCLTILATNNNGETCCERICYEIEVCPPGHCQVFPNFSSTVNFHHYTVSFTDLSTGTGSACDWFWDFGDGNTVSGVQNPVHSYLSPGFYYVCLRVTFCIYDAAGNVIDKCDGIYCQWVVVDQQHTLRQANGDLPSGDDIVKVFPNPASTELFIAAKESLQPTVRIINASGQEVSKAEISAKNLYRVDVATLAPGLYMVEVVYPDGTSKHVQFVKD